MANTFAPLGFRQFQGTGAAPTYEQTQMAIASSNTTAIFAGDPVIMATGTTGLPTGYITQAPAPATYSITGGTLTAGVMALAGTFSPVIPVGSVISAYGFTSTAATVNGNWVVIASSATTVSFNFPGAFTTGTGSIAVYTPLVGVFIGCEYLSTASKRKIWSNYAPGSDYNGDVTAYVVNDPDAQFLVQTGNSNTTTTAVGITGIGQTIDFSYSLNGASPASVNGNTSNGLSSYFADQYTLSANFPSGYQNVNRFRIIGPVGYMPGPTTIAAAFLGSSVLTTNADFTSAYNNIVVGFNQTVFKSVAGV